MERANPPPDELARAADPVMIIERALDDIGLLDLRVLVHGHQVVDGNGKIVGHGSYSKNAVPRAENVLTSVERSR